MSEFRLQHEKNAPRRSNDDLKRVITEQSVVGIVLEDMTGDTHSDLEQSLVVNDLKKSLHYMS